MIHDLKCEMPYFEHIHTGRKPFEVRRDDRAYAEGDTLHLREWDGSAYTGRSLDVRVTYILRCAARFGVADGFAVLGIDLEPQPASGVCPTCKGSGLCYLSGPAGGSKPRPDCDGTGVWPRRPAGGEREARAMRMFDAWQRMHGRSHGVSDGAGSDTEAGRAWADEWETWMAVEAVVEPPQPLADAVQAWRRAAAIAARIRLHGMNAYTGAEWDDFTEDELREIEALARGGDAR